MHGIEYIIFCILSCCFLHTSVRAYRVSGSLNRLSALQHNVQSIGRDKMLLMSMENGNIYTRPAVVSDVLIEAPSVNSRRITANAVIDCPIEDVWSILTDYNSLSTHVPNLVKSHLVPSPVKGGIRLFQEGAQKIAGFNFRASLTMDMVEEAEDENKGLRERKISFKLAESAMFASFDGSWTIRYRSRSKTRDPITGDFYFSYKTILSYSVLVKPKGLVPVMALEWRIREDIPVNLNAVKAAAEKLHLVRRSKPSLPLPPAVSPTASENFSDSSGSDYYKNNNGGGGPNSGEDSLFGMRKSTAASATSNEWGVDETLGAYIS